LKYGLLAKRDSIFTNVLDSTVAKILILGLSVMLMANYIALR